MSVAHALTTVARVKTFLDIPDVSDDAVLDILVDQATDMIESFCGRRFVADISGANYANVTEYHDGGCAKNILNLRRYPIASIVSISYNTGTNNSPVWTPFSPAYDYQFNSNTGEVIFGALLPKGFQNIRVVYTAGYQNKAGSPAPTSAPVIPSDLESACMMLVSMLYNKRKSIGASAENLGGSTLNWIDGLPEEIRQILFTYKNLAF
ncbi:MAG: hypothetical protein E6R04_11910 [Spirochaetes bacterium]|nr:MAG: hypothetical protein E6R04_11910 [Spirochaetota bacterium]